MYEGRLLIGTTEPNTVGFVLIKGLDELISIEESDIFHHRVINEDIIIVKILPRSAGGRGTARIIDVSKRNSKNLTGILKRIKVILFSFLKM